MDFCGNEISVVFSRQKNPIRNNQSRSAFQEDCGKVLIDKYPFYTILEEWIIPRSNGLSLDFFIPDIMLAVECQGIQHTKFSKFFHGTIDNFLAQKKRDAAKRDWCSKNNIELIEAFTAEDLVKILEGL